MRGRGPAEKVQSSINSARPSRHASYRGVGWSGGVSAEVQLAEARPREALEDLNDVMRTRRPNSRVLLLRAVAYRQMGNGVAARDDAAYALELDETKPKAWLERGRADAMLGDKPAARKALLRAIELDRDGPVGRAAQLSLQRLEAGLTQ